MTTRHTLAAVLAAALLGSGTVAATEPAVISAPGVAISHVALDSLRLDTSAAVPTSAELRRLKNELRFEVQGALKAALGESFEHALDDTVVIADD